MGKIPRPVSSAADAEPKSRVRIDTVVFQIFHRAQRAQLPAAPLQMNCRRKSMKWSAPVRPARAITARAGRPVEPIGAVVFKHLQFASQFRLLILINQNVFLGNVFRLADLLVLPHLEPKVDLLLARRHISFKVRYGGFLAIATRSFSS